MTMRASHVLVETLALHGVDRFFCVPGESYLGFMDALYDSPKIQGVTCRHEGGAAWMALADGKLTGRPGVVFASRGPGSTHASVALFSAARGAMPLVAMFGQVERNLIDKGAGQEIDYKGMFSGFCKHVEQVNQAERLPEVVARAFHLAVSGTPGPVVVALPTDMLMEDIKAAPRGPNKKLRAAPNEAEVSLVADALAEAKRPVMIVGGECTWEHARGPLQEAAERFSIPVMPSYEHQDCFTHSHPCYAGELGIRPPKPIRETAQTADLVLAVGTRMHDKASLGFSVPGEGQRLIHIYPDADVIGKLFPTEHGVVADAGLFLAALAERNAPPPDDGRKAWLERSHKAYTDYAAFTPRDQADGIDFGHVVKAVGEKMPDDGIVTIDAGSFGTWVNQRFPYKNTMRLLGSEAGAMSMGIPAAVAAGIRYPDRQVVCFVGDGGALMSGSEMATAIKENAKIRVFVSNNGNYGTIRLHQEMHHPERNTNINDLVNPDFAAYAASFGALGLKIDKPEDVAGVVEQAFAHNGPVMVDVNSSLETISALTTITEVRAAK
jgi:acetolactate synthase-1/2/3 large subunit